MIKSMVFVLLSFSCLYAADWSKLKTFFDSLVINNPLGNVAAVGYPLASKAFEDFSNSGDIIFSRDVAKLTTFYPVSYNNSYRIPVSFTIDNMSEIKGCVVVMVVKYRSDALGNGLADIKAAIESAFTGDEFSVDNQTGVVFVRDRVFLYYIKSLEGWVFIGGEAIFGMKRFCDFFNPLKNPFGQTSTGEPTVEINETKASQ